MDGLVAQVWFKPTSLKKSARSVGSVRLTPVCMTSVCGFSSSMTNFFVIAGVSETFDSAKRISSSILSLLTYLPAERNQTTPHHRAWYPAVPFQPHRPPHDPENQSSASVRPLPAMSASHFLRVVDVVKEKR